MKRVGWVLADVLLCCGAFAVAAPTEVDSPAVQGLLLGGWVAAAAAGMGVYRRLWRYAQAEDFLRCAVAVAAGSAAFCLAGRSSVGIDGVFAGVLSTLLCLLARLLTRAQQGWIPLRRRSKPIGRRRVLLVGAGAAAARLLEECRGRSDCDWVAVAAVDDDPAKYGHRIGGVRIAGATAEIPTVCRRAKVDLIVVAMASASNRRRAQLLEICAQTTCEVRMLPALSDLGARAGLLDSIRGLTAEELLGREPIRTENDASTRFLRGRTVLVTGAGGSVGSELCRQIASCAPRRLILLDICENGVYELQQALKMRYGAALDVSVAIASVRDAPRLNQLFERERPWLVLHAAAHKHVPLMEDCPQEAIKNNVLGTQNAAQAAARYGCARFVLISTDKAVRPRGVMGASKRLAEGVVQAQNGGSDTIFTAVRFGNVLGSAGSVVPLFRQQIAAGGPVTVTDPEVTRYFMTIPEAAQLVLTAASLARGGELFILEMGSPVKIDTLARRMIALAGLVPDRDIAIRYTGLRPGEKLTEQLCLPDETLIPAQGSRLRIMMPPAVDREALERGLTALYACAQQNQEAELLEQLHRLLPEFGSLPE